MVGNGGIANLSQTIKEQSKRTFEVNERTNMLGTITSKGIRLDGIDEDIPRNEFLYMKSLSLSSGDRVLCVPVGDYYVVVGRVTNSA